MAKKNGSAAASAVEPQPENVTFPSPAAEEPGNGEAVTIVPDSQVELETIHADGEVVSEGNLLTSPTMLGSHQFAELLRASQNLKEKTQVVSVVPKYYEFTKAGEVARGIFLGYTTIRKKENGLLIPIRCVQWMDNGHPFVNGGKALVSTFEQLNLKIGTAFEIVFEERKERVKIYDVRLIA